MAKLKETGFVSKTVKTFNKSARAVWSEYETAFQGRNVPATVTLLKASKQARDVCRGVNMTVIGDFVVYPTAKNNYAKLRETKHGVFIDYGASRKYTNTIILSKDGDHLAYGHKLSKRRSGGMHAYGTLKTHMYKVGGVEVNGFMRDTTRLYTDPLSAMSDNRYSIDTESAEIEYANFDSLGDYYDAARVSNGITALIRVNF